MTHDQWVRITGTRHVWVSTCGKRNRWYYSWDGGKPYLAEIDDLGVEV